MQRRAFIGLSAFTATILTLPFLPGCRKPIDPESQPLFFSHVVDAKTIVDAGKAYIIAHQNENDVNRLKTLLLPNGPQSANEKAISAQLLNKINNDFKTGNIVTVDGWVLSQTEARQCALFSMLRS